MANKLKAAQLDSLAPREEPYSDGGGVYFAVAPVTAERTWKFRFTDVDGSRPFITFGKYDPNSPEDTGLKWARGMGVKLRNESINGRDPRKLLKPTDDPAGITFIALVNKHIDDWCEGGNKRMREEWDRALASIPSLHDLPIATISVDDVLAAFRPLWKKTPITASRTLGKVAKVFRIAILKELRTRANPAVYKDGIDQFLKDPREMQLKVKGARLLSRKALPYDELPDFMGKLSYDENISSRAVEFAILICARSIEVRHAEWTWVDEIKKTITFSEGVMKARKKHAVPLSSAAWALLMKLPRRGKYIFPSSHTFDQANAMEARILLTAVRRIKNVDLHAFRATFRNWGGEKTETPREVLEFCLAHVVGDAAEKAYWTGEMIERRRKVLEAWGAYATSKTPKGRQGDNVVAIKRAA